MEKGEQVTDEQMQRAHDLLYSCESREELCERIVALEELVRDMVDYGEGASNGMAEFFAGRMTLLGIEVES